MEKGHSRPKKESLQRCQLLATNNPQEENNFDLRGSHNQRNEEYLCALMKERGSTYYTVQHQAKEGGGNLNTVREGRNHSSALSQVAFDEYDDQN